jgi:hypothetical protein
VDERELLRAQIKSYEFYAGLIERAVGGGAQAKLPRWDEQRAAEYRALADQLRRRLAELEAQDQTPQHQDQTPLQTASETQPETTSSDEAQSIMVPSGDSSATPRR